MITAVDTSVLLDVYGADSEYGPRSAEALRKCLAEGSVIACEVVWAETGACFATTSDAEAALRTLRVDFSRWTPQFRSSLERPGAPTARLAGPASELSPTS